MAESATQEIRMDAKIAPVGLNERITSIDVVRGVALLGILLVNIHYMGMPSGIFFVGNPPADATPPSTAAWYFYRTFCEGKFYPLFSMLFGAGLAIQFERARQRGSNWWAAPFRRVIALGFFGLLHATLLWFGDILFLYALVGFVMIFLVRLSTKWLVIAAGVLVLTTLAMVALSVLMTAFGGHFTEQKPAQEFVLDERPPLTQLFDGLNGRLITGPWDGAWQELETRSLRDGPYLQAVGFRAINWSMMLAFMLFGGGPVILALFLFGAILVRMQFFAPDNAVVQRRVAVLGWTIGLACAIVSVFAHQHQARAWAVGVLGVTHSLGGPILSLGYLGTLVLWANQSRHNPVAVAFSNAGRMALSSYLLCSFIGTAIFYHWGLSWFGQLSVAERLLAAMGVYTIVAVFATVWLRFFAFGPMEWIWRTVTYLRFPPVRRRDAATTLAV
ncbi:MAG: DUF418 domain-containing protein [Planctomycetes bacterium]|nr:DUF418 domain-containing protein [Planctomycetota bacterium]